MCEMQPLPHWRSSEPGPSESPTGCPRCEVVGKCTASWTCHPGFARSLLDRFPNVVGSAPEWIDHWWSAVVSYTLCGPAPFLWVFLFSRGHGLYEFRHLLVIIQQRFPWVKPHLSPAWQLITRWQVLQPVQHRKPLHWVLCQAMASLAILKNWQRWTAVLLLGFFGIARISEVLRALRSTFRTV